MNDETTRIAERYGITEKCEALEHDLLSIDGVTSAEFDLNGFLDDIHQVIVLVGYDYHKIRSEWSVAGKIVEKALLYHDLNDSGDLIEDYGEHLYLVFNCGPSWLKRGDCEAVERYLAELHDLVKRENDGETLSESDKNLYVWLVDEIHRRGGDIPFGIEI